MLSKGRLRGPLDAEKLKTILVVEDDEDLLEMLVEVMAAAGYEVGWATNGAGALEEIRRGGVPSLIILDMHMPVMTGAEFLEARMADPDLRKVPVVVMSAHPVNFSRAAFGIVDVIVKPFSVDAILRVAKTYTGLNLTH